MMPQMVFARTAVCALLVASAAGAVTPSNEAKARSASESARKAYDLGHFEDALRGYSEAYDLAPRPELLFNVGQCHRQLGHFEQAAFFYRRFLTLSPREPQNAGAVRRLVEDMEAKQAEARRLQRIEQQRQADEARAKAAEAETVRQRASLLQPVNPPESTASEFVALPAPPPSKPVYGRWWVWAAVGAGALALAGG